MNIFWLDYDLEKNVSYYCDQHVVKMMVEYAQLLSTACRLSGLDCGYKITHVNHPCSLWVRESLMNWKSLREMAYCLSDEFYYRYSNAHKSFFVIRDLEVPDLPNKDLTQPLQCMPSMYKGYDLVTAYRNYYIVDKARFARWSKRPVPSWFNYEGKLIKN